MMLEYNEIQYQAFSNIARKYIISVNEYDVVDIQYICLFSDRKTTRFYGRYESNTNNNQNECDAQNFFCIL
jgi:hypothetical protein